MYKPVNSSTGMPYAVWFRNGEYQRRLFNSSNINLMNTRIRLSRNLAMSFGANIRSVNNVSTSRYNYIDTISSSNSFLGLNVNNQPFKADVLSSSWAEMYGTIATTLRESANSRLNIGLTLKANKGISGIVLKESGRND